MGDERGSLGRLHLRGRRGAVPSGRVHAGRSPAWGAQRPLPPRGQPGELPRALRRVPAAGRGRGAPPESVGLRALPARHRPHPRRRRRRALPRLHDGRARGLARERASSTPLGGGPPPRRRRGGGDDGSFRGLCLAAEVAARPAEGWNGLPGPDGQVAPCGEHPRVGVGHRPEGRAGRERGPLGGTQRPATSPVSTSWRRRAVRTTTSGRGHHGDVPRRRECPRRRCVRGGRVLGRRIVRAHRPARTPGRDRRGSCGDRNAVAARGHGRLRDRRAVARRTIIPRSRAGCSG